MRWPVKRHTITRLAGLAQRLVVEVGSEGFLARALRDAVGDFDVVLVDCPPELGQLTTNALFACSEVVVPVAMTDKNSCNGAVDLMDTLAVYGERGATSAVTALVRSHVKPWENTYKTLNEDLEQLDVPLAVTEIPATVEFSKASIKRRPLTQSRPRPEGRGGVLQARGRTEFRIARWTGNPSDTRGVREKAEDGFGALLSPPGGGPEQSITSARRGFLVGASS